MKGEQGEFGEQGIPGLVGFRGERGKFLASQSTFFFVLMQKFFFTPTLHWHEKNDHNYLISNFRPSQITLQNHTKFFRSTVNVFNNRKTVYHTVCSIDFTIFT